MTPKNFYSNGNAKARQVKENKIIENYTGAISWEGTPWKSRRTTAA